MVKSLEAVLAVREKFKAEHVSNILSGDINSAIKSYKHDKLSIFGTGSEEKPKFWNAVLRQALIAGFTSKDIENYGLLKLTQKGKDYLKNPVSFMITEDHEYEVSDDQGSIPPGSRTSAVDEELFRILADLRKKISKKLNLPPFVIFQDPSLEDMAIQYPIAMEELQNVQGVGTGKAQRYGKEFIELIKIYVDEKEIIRPQDMVVKSVVNKSGLKVFIIHSIDRKMSLEDISDAKNLEMNDLLKEIEAIVNSGTKLNINYYIDEVLDTERQDEIYEYFREAETESIDEAINELGEEEYSEEDIRLMRIRFLAEMGH